MKAFEYSIKITDLATPAINKILAAHGLLGNAAAKNEQATARAFSRLITLANKLASVEQYAARTAAMSAQAKIRDSERLAKLESERIRRQMANESAAARHSQRMAEIRQRAMLRGGGGGGRGGGGSGGRTGGGSGSGRGGGLFSRGGLNTGLIGRALPAVGAFLTARGAVNLIGDSTQAFIDREQSITQFGIMGRSESFGRELYGQMRDYATNSPARLENLQKAAQTMLSFGMENERIMPSMKQLSTAAAFNPQQFERLALAFAQTRAAGKLMGQEMLQYVNAGFSPLLEISERTGVSMTDLRKIMEGGGISFDMVALALQSATSAGGRYDKMVEKLSGTSFAAQQRVQNLAQMLMGDFGEALDPITKKVFQLTEGFLQGLSPAIKSLKGELSGLNDPLSNISIRFDEIALSIQRSSGGLKDIPGNIKERVRGFYEIFKAIANPTAGALSSVGNFMDAFNDPERAVKIGQGLKTLSGAYLDGMNPVRASTGVSKIMSAFDRPFNQAQYDLDKRKIDAMMARRIPKGMTFTPPVAPNKFLEFERFAIDNTLKDMLGMFDKDYGTKKGKKKGKRKRSGPTMTRGRPTHFVFENVKFAENVEINTGTLEGAVTDVEVKMREMLARVIASAQIIAN